MAYTLANLRDKIRNYTKVSSTVWTNASLDTTIKNSENKIYRSADNDDNRFYATSTLVTGNRYVTIPSDLRIIRYAQLKDTSTGAQFFLEKKDTSYMATYYDTPGPAQWLHNYYDNWDANFRVIPPTPDAQSDITFA